VITARPTIYNGIQMRSRLEARVAGQLDGYGSLDWTYEPMAYADRRGQYLPDFKVKAPWFEHDVFVEVKPTEEAATDVVRRMEIIRSSTVCDLVVAWSMGDGQLGSALDCHRKGYCSGCFTVAAAIASDRADVQFLWRVHHCADGSCAFLGPDDFWRQLPCEHQWTWVIGTWTKARCTCGQKWT
jgi:hypothetical protein